MLYKNEIMNFMKITKINKISENYRINEIFKNYQINEIYKHQISTIRLLVLALLLLHIINLTSVNLPLGACFLGEFYE